MSIQAYCGYRNGASGVRSVATAEEAENILRGGYGVTTVRLQDEKGEVVGMRAEVDYLDRGKWSWWFDPDAFPVPPPLPTKERVLK